MSPSYQPVCTKTSNWSCHNLGDRSLPEMSPSTPVLAVMNALRYWADVHVAGVFHHLILAFLYVLLCVFVPSLSQSGGHRMWQAWPPKRWKSNDKMLFFKTHRQLSSLKELSHLYLIAPVTQSTHTQIGPICGCLFTNDCHELEKGA